MDSFGETLIMYWPIITLFLMGVWWVSRSIAKLESTIEKLETRMRNAEEKVVTLFELWNHHIDRLLNERKPKE